MKKKEYDVLERFGDLDPRYARKNFLDSDAILVPAEKEAGFMFSYCLPEKRYLVVNGGQKGKTVRQVARLIRAFYSKQKDMDMHDVDDLTLDTIIKVRNASKYNPVWYEVDFSS